MKAINYVSLLIGMIGFTTCYSQTNTNKPPVKIWDKTLKGGHILSSAVLTHDGGFIMVGNSGSRKFGDKTEDSKGDIDIWVVKVNSNGEKIWDKTFGGANNDNCQSVISTSDGGFIIVGNSFSNISGDKSAINKTNTITLTSDYWIIKINNKGEKIWDKTIGGNYIDQGMTIIETKDGGFILAGDSYSGISDDKTDNCKGESDFWIVKINSKGEKVWDKTFGGSDSEHCYAITNTSDNGFIIAGSSRSNKSGDKSEYNIGDNDAWILKINQNGEKIWDKTIGGKDHDTPKSIIRTFDNNFLIVRSSGSYLQKESGMANNINTFDGSDFWVLKITNDGDFIWNKTFGGSKSDFGNSVFQTLDGGFIVSGSSLSSLSRDKTEENKGKVNFWVFKIDRVGKKIWDKTLGGNFQEDLSSMIYINDNTFLLVGISSSDKLYDKSESSKDSREQNSRDYWLVKLGFQ